MTCNVCADMATRIEELQAEVGNLKSELYNPQWWPPPELNMTPAETAILRVLVKHDRVLTNEFLVETSRLVRHGNISETPDMNIAKVFICKIRAKLKPYGVMIHTEYATGYRMTEANRKKLLAIGKDT